MYEKLSESFLSRRKFLARMMAHAAFVLVLMAASILAGVVGFILLEGKEIEDAVLHSAYMLSGLGLLEVPSSFAGKLFIGFYGLYASMFFLAAFGIIFAPVVHRILHKLHLD